MIRVYADAGGIALRCDHHVPRVSAPSVRAEKRRPGKKNSRRCNKLNDAIGDVQAP
jgi:hypothetical protein